MHFIKKEKRKRSALFSKKREEYLSGGDNKEKGNVVKVKKKIDSRRMREHQMPVDPRSLLAARCSLASYIGIALTFTPINPAP